MEEGNNIIENNSKKGNGSKAIIVLLTIVIVLLIGLVILLIIKPSLFSSTTTNTNTNSGATKDTADISNTKDNTTDNSSEKDNVIKTFNLADFDGSKVINDDTLNYNPDYLNEAEVNFGTQPAHAGKMILINTILNENKKEVTVTIMWNKLADGSNDQNLEPKEYTYTISNFDRKIRKVYVSGWGQAVGAETIFYLMEDGSLEYTPITHKVVNNSLANPEAVTLKSSGKVEGVKDIVILATTTASPKNSNIGGHYTVLAIKADGTFYNIPTILNGKDVYKYN